MEPAAGLASIPKSATPDSKTVRPAIDALIFIVFLSFVLCPCILAGRAGKASVFDSPSDELRGAEARAKR